MKKEIVENMKLPDKSSKLLLLALRDLELIERDPNYKVNMGVFHDSVFKTGSKCSVCLAGSVIAKTLKCPKEFGANITPDAYPFHIWGKLYLLDNMRQGIFEQLGFNEFDLAISEASHNDRQLWKQHMYDMVSILEAEGF